jgi:folate-binding protein YgfZ
MNLAELNLNVRIYTPSKYKFITVKGKDSIDLLDRLTTNDLKSLKSMEHAYSLLVSPKGRMIEMLSVLNLEGQIILGCSADSLNKVLEWIDFYTFGEEVEIILDQKDYQSKIMIMGENSISFINFIFGIDMSLSEGKSMFIALNKQHYGRIKLLIVNKNYFDFGHYEIYASREDVDYVLKLFKQNRRNFKKVDNKFVDYLNDDKFNNYRIVNNLAGYPTEINENYNPLEAGLKKYINFSKGCYIGQEVIARLDTYSKVKNRLVLIKSDTEVDSELINKDKHIGNITSYTSPDFYNGDYKLAYIKKSFIKDIESDFNFINNTGSEIKVYI